MVEPFGSRYKCACGAAVRTTDGVSAQNPVARVPTVRASISGKARRHAGHELDRHRPLCD
jgi:hypothetical protein